jgi:hypothetical protein
MKVRRHFTRWLSACFTQSRCVGGLPASENVTRCFQLRSDVAGSKQAVGLDTTVECWVWRPCSY